MTSPGFMRPDGANLIITPHSLRSRTAGHIPAVRGGSHNPRLIATTATSAAHSHPCPKSTPPLDILQGAGARAIPPQSLLHPNH